MTKFHTCPCPCGCKVTGVRGPRQTFCILCYLAGHEPVRAAA